VLANLTRNVRAGLAGSFVVGENGLFRFLSHR
jgi:hypothetical protein